MYDFGVGRWASARESLEEGIQIAERLGAWRDRDYGLKLRGLLSIYQGDFAQGARLDGECYASARRRHDAQMKACGLQGLIDHALVGGQLDTALDLAEEAVALAGETEDYLAQLWTNGVLGLVRLRRGEQLLALQAADTAARFISGCPPMGLWTRDGYTGVAEVYLTLWEAGNPEYARPARQACTAIRKYARVFPIGGPSVGLYQGLAEWLGGHPTRAAQAWQKGLVVAERLAMPPDQARLHYEIGRHLPTQDPARCQHLERACALFEQMGATYDLARATEALRASDGHGKG
jgi:hypothetical protein